MPRQSIKYLPTEDLIPYENNPRINDEAIDGVAESIKQFGFLQPIVIDEEGIIVVGHTRLKAAQKLKLKEVPTLTTKDLTNDQINAYRLLDNKLNEKALWDIPKLADEIGELCFDFEPFDVDFTDLLPDPIINTEEDTIPELPEEAFSKLGDVWKCGKHTVVCGDALEVELPEVDAIITDPPYGTTACAWDSIIPLDKLWPKLNKAIKPSGAIVLFGSQPFTTTLISSNLKQFKYCWVWNKSKSDNIFLAKSQPMKIHEDIVIFGSNSPRFFPIKTERNNLKKSKNYGTGEALGGDKTKENKEYSYTHKNPVSIIDVSNAAQSGKVHPTQKPVALIQYLIKTYTKKTETVLDFTLGSGTTLIACERTNRTCYGIELEPKYIDIILQRYYNETGEVPIRENDGAAFPCNKDM